MIYRGYSERELISNRSSLLLYGANEAERRAWAEEAASNFAAEGPLRVVQTDDAFVAATAVGRGVVYVPNMTALRPETQRNLVVLLHGHGDRPKVLVGLSRHPDVERDSGALRSELHYALQVAHVNLDEPGLKEAIAARRARAAKRAPAPDSTKPAKPRAQNVVVTRKAAAPRNAVRKPPPAKKPASKPKAAPKKKSAARPRRQAR